MNYSFRPIRQKQNFEIKKKKKVRIAEFRSCELGKFTGVMKKKEGDEDN